ncbi:hypothetical protein ACWU4D_04345 [Vibrio sp. WJH972]
MSNIKIICKDLCIKSTLENLPLTFHEKEKFRLFTDKYFIDDYMTIFVNPFCNSYLVNDVRNLNIFIKEFKEIASNRNVIKSLEGCEGLIPYLSAAVGKKRIHLVRWRDGSFWVNGERVSFLCQEGLSAKTHARCTDTQPSRIKHLEDYTISTGYSSTVTEL